MRKNLPANQRMVRIDVVPFQAEDLFQISGSRPRGPWASPCAAAACASIEVYRRGALPIPGSSSTSKELEIGPDVERQSVVGDRAADGHAHRGDSSRPRKDPGQVRANRPREVKFLQHQHDRRLQPVKVVLQG